MPALLAERLLGTKQGKSLWRHPPPWKSLSWFSAKLLHQAGSTGEGGEEPGPGEMLVGGWTGAGGVDGGVGRAELGSWHTRAAACADLAVLGSPEPWRGRDRLGREPSVGLNRGVPGGASEPGCLWMQPQAVPVRLHNPLCRVAQRGCELGGCVWLRSQSGGTPAQPLASRGARGCQADLAFRQGSAGLNPGVLYENPTAQSGHEAGLC